MTVAARKPAQSFEPADDPALRDAHVLGAASGEPPGVVCPPHRWYEVPMAPPMAAEALGRPPFAVADLVHELRWPHDHVEVGLVETAGGVRSPLAADGDCLLLCGVLEPDLVVLVADAGLGTINAVRLTVEALGDVRAPVVIVLNRFDAADVLHERNREWLRRRDGSACAPSLGARRSWRSSSRAVIRSRDGGTDDIPASTQGHPHSGDASFLGSICTAIPGKTLNGPIVCFQHLGGRSRWAEPVRIRVAGGLP